MKFAPFRLFASTTPYAMRPDFREEETAVIVRGLSKSYGEIPAVDGLSFEVRRGEVFGLLGPNGAGKTTAVEIIEGLRRADGGEVRVCGFDPIAEADEVKQRLGVGLQATALPDRIKVREALVLFAGFYRWRAQVDELLALISLRDKADEQFCRLSGGQRQRLAIALALVNDPQVVILDEPTAGLDPQARRESHGIIERLRDRGRAVILTTHYIEEAEKLCDRVGIMAGGRLLALDAPRRIIAQHNGYSRIEFGVTEPLAPAALRQLPYVESVSESAGVYSLRTADAPRAAVELITWLEAERRELLDLRIVRPTLEDVFIELTGGNE
jgi:ABC-2 type transport system ATP-binding protein